MIVNEEKRAKFMEYAGKRVNNVMHDMQILEPMARSAAYDFTKQDVEEMFAAMQETLDAVRAEYEKKFEEKARSEKKVFSFGQSTTAVSNTTVTEPITASSVTANAEHLSSVDEVIDHTTTPEEVTDIDTNVTTTF